MKGWWLCGMPVDRLHDTGLIGVRLSVSSVARVLGTGMTGVRLSR